MASVEAVAAADSLRAVVSMVKAHHSYDYRRGKLVCRECSTAWPCESWLGAENTDHGLRRLLDPNLPRTPA
jgi:hypothetical protein